MPLVKLSIGNGINYDVDGTSVQDGALVTLINAYEDRSGAKRILPPRDAFAILETSDQANRKVYLHDSKNFNFLLAVVNGRIYRLTEADGAFVEITGATLDPDAIPQFTEDFDYVYIAANSQIYKINATNTAVLSLGTLVPGDDVTLVSIHLLTIDGVKNNTRTITLTSRGGYDIYWTKDGSIPDKTKNLYTGAITTSSPDTVRAISITDEDIYSNEITEDTFSCAIFAEGETPNPRRVSFKADGASAIYYTTNGDIPTSASSLYSPGNYISIETDGTFTVKGVAYKADGSISKVVSAEYTVKITDFVAPNLKLFTVGAVEHNKVIITNCIAKDAVNVTGYLITESVTSPSLADKKWSVDPLKEYYTEAGAGTRNIYLWCRDAQGNRNRSGAISVTFQAPITAPKSFALTSKVNVARDTLIVSEKLAFPEITGDTTITVSGLEYAISKDSGGSFTDWVTTAGTFSRGDVIRFRLRSSSAYGSTVFGSAILGGTTASWTIKTLVTQVPTNVTQLTYLAGYLLAKGLPPIGDPVSGDVIYSDDKLGNYAKWDVYNNESNADDLQALLVAFEQVYNIGTSTLEVAIIDGTTPFAVNKNQFQHYGTIAPNSVTFDTQSIYYLTEILGTRYVLSLYNGGAPKLISMPINIPLEQIETITDANGYMVGFRGNNFYCLDFPTANITIDDQIWEGVTLAYHLQKESWGIFGRYNSDQSIYESFNAISTSYIDRWGISLIGGKDGVIYRMYDTTTNNYTDTPTIRHRWRDDHRSEWKNPREIKLYPIGNTLLPQDQNQCGLYRCRQHEIEYNDLSENGELFRAIIKTGWISHGADQTKVSSFYRYNFKAGSNEFILNSISEQVELLRR